MNGSFQAFSQAISRPFLFFIQRHTLHSGPILVPHTRETTVSLTATTIACAIHQASARQSLKHLSSHLLWCDARTRLVFELGALPLGYEATLLLQTMPMPKDRRRNVFIHQKL